MKEKIKCKEVLDALCRLDDVYDTSKINPLYRTHLENCNRCSSYLSSLHSTISLYRNYNINLPKDIQKKILENVCCKLKNSK